MRHAVQPGDRRAALRRPRLRCRARRLETGVTPEGTDLQSSRQCLHRRWSSSRPGNLLRLPTRLGHNLVRLAVCPGARLAGLAVGVGHRRVGSRAGKLKHSSCHILGQIRLRLRPFPEHRSSSAGTRIDPKAGFSTAPSLGRPQPLDEARPLLVLRRDLARLCIGAVIHISTGPFVHTCAGCWPAFLPKASTDLCTGRYRGWSRAVVSMSQGRKP